MSRPENFFFKDLGRTRSSRQRVNLLVNDRWSSHRTSPRLGNASSCLEGAFPLSYKRSDTRCSQMIKSKCATTVSVSQRTRHRQQPGRCETRARKSMLTMHGVDTDYSQFVGASRKRMKRPQKKREQKKRVTSVKGQGTFKGR